MALVAHLGMQGECALALRSPLARHAPRARRAACDCPSQSERARFASRAASAEEQLAQLQAYMTDNIASYQKEIRSLRRQVVKQLAA